VDFSGTGRTGTARSRRSGLLASATVTEAVRPRNASPPPGICAGTQGVAATPRGAEGVGLG